MARQIDRAGSAGIAGLLITAGAVAFGGFLSHRHRNRNSDDAAERAKRQPEGDLALVGRSVTIRKPRSELYAFWRDFSNLPKTMENVERIESKGDDRSVWTIKAPAGQTVSLVTENTEDRADECIAWRSVEGSTIETEGQVTFTDAPGERGTRVSLTIAYDPPGGAIGQSLAKLFLLEPGMQARHDLKRFKMLMETGEIATSARTREEASQIQLENGQ